MLRMLKAIDYNNGGSFEVEFENNRMYFVRPHAHRNTFALNTKATLLFIPAAASCCQYQTLRTSKYIIKMRIHLRLRTLACRSVCA